MAGSLDDAFAAFLGEVGEPGPLSVDATAPPCAAGGSLDDAFAAFLSEVGEPGQTPGDVAEATPEATPAAKRPKLTAAPDDEGAAQAKRVKRAEALRRAAFVGDAGRVERVLGKLSAVDRLMLVDDLDPDDGFAAMHLAVIRGHSEIVKLLVGKRADVDVLSADEDTPLMWAAHQGNAALVRDLLHAGADTALKNRRDRDAVAQALAAGHRRIKELLENHRFDTAVGLKRHAAAVTDAAAARRAANLRMVEDAIRQQKEQEEEEAYWRRIRERRESREAAGGGGRPAGRPAPADAGPGAAAGDAGAESEADAEAAAALARLPDKVRPHFRTLGAPGDASDAEIRKLYRRLALAHHPDKHPEDPVKAKAKFTEIALAYEAVCEYLSSTPLARGACVPPPAQ